MKKILFIAAMITLMVFSMPVMANLTGGCGGGNCGGDCGGGNCGGQPSPCPECRNATEVFASTTSLPSDLDHSYYYIWNVNLSIPTGQVISSAGLSIYGINDWQIEPDVLHIRLLSASDISDAVSDLGMTTKSYGARGYDNQGNGDALGAYGQLIDDYVDYKGPSQCDVQHTRTYYEKVWVPRCRVNGHWVAGHYNYVLKTVTWTETVNDPENLCYSSDDPDSVLASLIGTAPSVIGIGLDPDCHYDYDKIVFWYCTEKPPTVPAPGAVLLGGIGVALVGWLRRRRTL